MATFPSDQMVDGYRAYPIDDHGKVRMQYFSISALTAAYAANDQVNLFMLPPGRKRLLPNHSRISCSAFGAGRTIDIGHRTYMKRPPDNDLEPEDGDAFIDGMDVSAQLNASVWSTVLKFDMYSLDEIQVFMTILGGTMPIGATMQGVLAYLYE